MTDTSLPTRETIAAQAEMAAVQARFFDALGLPTMAATHRAAAETLRAMAEGGR